MQSRVLSPQSAPRKCLKCNASVGSSSSSVTARAFGRVLRGRRRHASHTTAPWRIDFSTTLRTVAALPAQLAGHMDKLMVRPSGWGGFRRCTPAPEAPPPEPLVYQLAPHVQLHLLRADITQLEVDAIVNAGEAIDFHTIIPIHNVGLASANAFTKLALDGCNAGPQEPAECRAPSCGKSFSSGGARNAGARTGGRPARSKRGHAGRGRSGWRHSQRSGPRPPPGVPQRTHAGARRALPDRQSAPDQVPLVVASRPPTALAARHVAGCRPCTSC